MKQKFFKSALIVLVFFVNFLIFRKSLSESYRSFQGKNLVGEVKMGKLWGNFEKLRSEAVEFNSWSAADTIDLSLEPQTQGVVTYRLEKPESAKVTILQLGLAKPANGQNQVSVSIDRINWRIVKENKFLHMVPLDLTPFVNDRSQFWVKIEAGNRSSSETAVALYDFYLMFYGHEFVFPNLPLIFAATFLPIVIVFNPGKKKMLGFILFFAVFEISLYLAAKNLYLNRYHSFDSDVICLTQEIPKFLAANFPAALLGNYCGNKESLNPLIIIAGWQVFGFGSEMAIRLASFLFHLLTVVVSFWYGKKIRSLATGLIAALFVGTHQYLIELSSRGLRDTAFTLIILIFIYLLWETDLKKFRHQLAIFLAGFVSIYLRLHSLVQLLGLTVLFSLTSKQWRRGLLTTLMLALTASPIIINNLSIYNTWNYSEKMHLKWNANVEFAGRQGFPSKEAVTLDPFQGPEISQFDYFFKLHSFSDLVGSTLAGIKKAFEDLYFRYEPRLLWVFVFGAILMLRNKQLWYIPVLVFLLEIPHFFLATKNLVEHRSMTQSLPFIGLTIGYIIDRLWVKLIRF